CHFRVRSILLFYTIFFYVFFFFFSSRRRHTRSKRDWSSDACSSDLHIPLRTAGPMKSVPHPPAARRRLLPPYAGRRQSIGLRTRSEERRVGKEGRARWWPEE